MMWLGSDTLLEMGENENGSEMLSDRVLRKRRIVSYLLSFEILKYLVLWTCFMIFLTSEVLAAKI